MKISACWIAKNEEVNLPRSIASVVNAVDELVVVDTGSSDATVARAKQAGARVEHFTWTDDFSAARNYALSLVTGDVVIFIDADEWFSPALGKAAARELAALFSDSRVDGAQVWRSNLEKNTLAVQSQEYMLRILRGNAHIHYRGTIHEEPVQEKGAPLQSALLPWNLKHDGYAAGVKQGKNSRNTALLKKQLQGAQTGEERAKTLSYLLREYSLRGRNENALEMLRRLMDEPAAVRVWHSYVLLATAVLYQAMGVASACRPQVSRREIKSRLLKKMQKALPQDPSVKIAPLHYMILFENQDHLFLEALNREAPIGKYNGRAVDESMFWQRLAILYASAANICRRWGNRAAAFDFALASLTQTEEFFHQPALEALLWAMEGQPEADQILLLERLLASGAPYKLEWLVNGLRFETTLNLYYYYFKKQAEAGTAKRLDFLYVQMLRGKYDDLFKSVQKAQAEMPAGELEQILLLAGVCSENKAFLNLAEDKNTPAARLLCAFFSNKPLEQPRGEELALLAENYGLMATARPDGAEKFRALFAAAPLESLLCRSDYCLRAERYKELLAEDFSPFSSAIEVMNLRLYALAKEGEGEQVLQEVGRLINDGLANEETFASLLAVAQGAAAAGEEAAALYEAQRPLYEEFVDMQDVANTGYTEEEFTKKEIRALASLSLSGLDRALQADPFVTAVPRYLDALAAAAGVYEKNGLPAMAQHCLRRLAACNPNWPNVWANLARLFEQLGNAELAQQLALRAQEKG